MRTVFIVCLLLPLLLEAQTGSARKKEQAAIQRVKNLPVSKLDSNLPNVSLEYFLKYESENAPIKWEVNDCGEQSGDPAIDRERDVPMCVEADVDLKHGALTILIAVGTAKKGISGASTLFDASITYPTGVMRTIHRLGDLLREVHRPLPRAPRFPKERDLETPTPAA